MIYDGAVHSTKLHLHLLLRSALTSSGSCVSAGAGYNAAAGDYGFVRAAPSCRRPNPEPSTSALNPPLQVIVTEHVVCGTRVWALHGHLSKQSISASPKGKHVRAGEILGWLGRPDENGGWHPHVHFQLSLVEPVTHDMPGVVSTGQHAQALRTYPDPRHVLGQLYDGDGLFEPSDSKTQPHLKSRI